MIYLDHAATTPLDGEVLQAMMPYLTDVYGNPSSQHSAGRKAANAVTAARDTIARIVGVPASNIYFTAGGTEAANTALKGVCAASRERGRHIVLSSIEHPALLESARDMCAYGWELTLVDPDGNGIISPDSIAKALRPDTVFVGVMAANNEVGTVQPIADICAVVKQHGAFFFSDCVQTAGVLPFAQFPSDGIGFSAHKFYGPKGVGVLYIKGGARFARLLSGGNQERGLRAGTTNVAGAVGCACALERACAAMDKNNKKVVRLRDMFLKLVNQNIEGVHLNGDGQSRLPANANLSFDGCDGEQIVFGLDLAGVACSTGSACSSGAVTSSHVLTAMGLEEQRVKSAVRFTFGKDNTEEEVARSVDCLKAAVARIRRSRA